MKTETKNIQNQLTQCRDTKLISFGTCFRGIDLLQNCWPRIMRNIVMSTRGHRMLQLQFIFQRASRNAVLLFGRSLVLSCAFEFLVSTFEEFSPCNRHTNGSQQSLPDFVASFSHLRNIIEKIIIL